jgi:hypothetical protein
MSGPARRRRDEEIVKQAVRAVEQGGTATLTPGPSPGDLRSQGGGGNGSGTATASVGGTSIQDGLGRLRWMWGVSVWTEGGGDVFSDE